MERPNAVLAIFAVLVALMIIGEVSIYYSNPYSYGSDVREEDGRYLYDVESSGAAEFSIVEFLPGEFGPPSEVYVFYDPDYCSGSPVSFSQVQDVVDELAIRSQECSIIDVHRLVSLFEGDAEGKAVVFVNGALPDVVYSGSPGDPLLDWFDGGGTVYWLGKTMGMCSCSADGTVSEIPRGEDVLFGLGGINTLDGEATATNPDDGLGKALCMSGSEATYGLSTGLPDTLSLGYVTDDGFCSAPVSKIGNGMVGVIGGRFMDPSRTDLVQMIASGITYDSTPVMIEKVSVKGGSATGELVGADNAVVYIFSGGYYTNYGQRHTI